MHDKLSPVQKNDSITLEEWAKKRQEESINAAKAAVSQDDGEKLGSNIQENIDAAAVENPKLQTALDAIAKLEKIKEELKSHRYEGGAIQIEGTKDQNIDLDHLQLIDMEGEMGSADPEIAKNMKLGKQNMVIIENQDIDGEKGSLYLQRGEDGKISYKGNSIKKDKEMLKSKEKLKEMGATFTIDKDKGTLTIDPKGRKNTIIFTLKENREAFSDLETFDVSIEKNSEKSSEAGFIGRDLARNILLGSLVEDKKEIKNRESSKSSASEKYTSNIDKNESMVATEWESMNTKLDATKKSLASYEDKIATIKDTYNTNIDSKKSEEFEKSITASEAKIAKLIEGANTLKSAFDKNPADKEMAQNISAIIIAIEQENSTLDKTASTANELTDSVLKSLELRAEQAKDVSEGGDAEGQEGTAEAATENNENPENLESQKISDETITSLQGYSSMTSAELRTNPGFIASMQDALSVLFPEQADAIAAEKGLTDIYTGETANLVGKLQEKMGFFPGDEVPASIRLDKIGGKHTLNKMLEMHDNDSLYGVENPAEVAVATNTGNKKPTLTTEQIQAQQEAVAKKEFEMANKDGAMAGKGVKLILDSYDAQNKERNINARADGKSEVVTLIKVDNIYGRSIFDDVDNSSFRLEGGKINYIDTSPKIDATANAILKSPKILSQSIKNKITYQGKKTTVGNILQRVLTKNGSSGDAVDRSKSKELNAVIESGYKIPANVHAAVIKMSVDGSGTWENLAFTSIGDAIKNGDGGSLYEEYSKFGGSLIRDLYGDLSNNAGGSYDNNTQLNSVISDLIAQDPSIYKKEKDLNLSYLLGGYQDFVDQFVPTDESDDRIASID